MGHSLELKSHTTERHVVFAFPQLQVKGRRYQFGHLVLLVVETDKDTVRLDCELVLEDFDLVLKQVKFRLYVFRVQLHLRQ